MNAAVQDAVHEAVHEAVHDAVHEATQPQVHEAVQPPMHSAVHPPVHAVQPAVHIVQPVHIVHASPQGTQDAPPAIAMTVYAAVESRAVPVALRKFLLERSSFISTPFSSSSMALVTILSFSFILNYSFLFTT